MGSFYLLKSDIKGQKTIENDQILTNIEGLIRIRRRFSKIGSQLSFFTKSIWLKFTFLCDIRLEIPNMWYNRYPFNYFKFSFNLNKKGLFFKRDKSEKLKHSTLKRAKSGIQLERKKPNLLLLNANETQILDKSLHKTTGRDYDQNRSR